MLPFAGICVYIFSAGGIREQCFIFQCILLIHEKISIKVLWFQGKSGIRFLHVLLQTMKTIFSLHDPKKRFKVSCVCSSKNQLKSRSICPNSLYGLKRLMLMIFLSENFRFCTWPHPDFVKSVSLDFVSWWYHLSPKQSSFVCLSPSGNIWCSNTE